MFTMGKNKRKNERMRMDSTQAEKAWVPGTLCTLTKYFHIHMYDNVTIKLKILLCAILNDHVNDVNSNGIDCVVCVCNLQIEVAQMCCAYI